MGEAGASSGATLIRKLNGTNYSSWRFQMKLLLMEKDFWTTVDPGETKPEADKVDELRVFTSRQGKALAKICLNLETEQQQHIQHLNDPKEVWEELEKLYAPKDSKFRIVQLRRQLYYERLSGHANMNAYLGKINYIVTELTTIGDKIDDSDLAMIILCGLPESWDNVVSVICNLPETEFTSATVKRRLIAESERRDYSKNENASALTAQAKGGVRYSTMNFEKNSSSPTGKEFLRCFRCKKKGHIARECRVKGKKLHTGETDKNPATNAQGKPYNMSVIYNNSIQNEMINNDAWVIDSGATHHMTPNKEYFKHLEENQTGANKVTVANGDTVSSPGLGTALVHVVNSKGKAHKFEAKNTLYVPEIKHGVLSVQQMVENERRVIFDKRGCHIQDEYGNRLLEGEKCGRLYLIQSRAESHTQHADTSTSATCAVIDAKSQNSLDLWHKRFMHVSHDRIVKLCKEDVVLGITCTNVGGKYDTCDGCAKGKSTRQSFKKGQGNSANKECRILELVHADLMGPLDTPSWGGARYILCIIDEATRYVHVFFLKNKGDVLEQFKHWVVEAENQTREKLKRIRTDNGLEFCSEAWNVFCKSRGIKHERTMTYTPQQNGVAERMNRTLLDLVRSTIASSGLPKASWAELTYTAAYVRNRVTNKHDESKTPYELWVKRKPSVRHLRASGCITFVHKPWQTRKSKLSPRAQKGVLVGYAIRGRGWRVWLPESGRVIESRDCIFRENTTYAEDNRKTGLLGISPETLEEEETLDIVTPNTNRTHQTEGSQNEESDQTENKESNEKRRSEKGERVRCHPMTLRSRDKSNTNQLHNVELNTMEFNSEGEPSSYDEAVRGPDAEKWIAAMEEEMNSLQKHHVWELTDIPEKTTPIKCKWVFKKKTDALGNVEKYKARLVAKGFDQRKGIDFDEVYSPVSSFETTRLLTALGVEEGWILDHYDVKGAYLHGSLNETLYMCQPDGFVDSDRKHMFCKLNKAIYGLKQSGRCWNEYMDKRLKEAGFERNALDPCIYTLKLKEGTLVISVYVDDILTCSQNEAIRIICKEILTELFDCKFLGPVSYLLGVQFTKNEHGSMTLTQNAYINNLLQRFGLCNAKAVATPMETRLTSLDGDAEEQENLPYRELIGGLLYLAQRTRPDIIYAVNRLAQYSSNYNRQCWNAAKRVLRYVASTKEIGVTYEKTGKNLIAYSDADWATCPDDRKSTTGYVALLAGGPVIWRSVKQRSIALSTMEAEYVAASECVRQIVWMRELITQLNLGKYVQEPTVIKCDNQAAIAHASSYIDKSRTKHISIRYHFIREKIQEGIVKMEFLPSEQNLADIFTKSLNQGLHDKHMKRLTSSK